LRKEVQDNNQYNRTSAQQRQIPTENWYAATIVSVGKLYLTVSYLTIDKTDKLHIVDDARRVRIYLDNFDDYIASHAAAAAAADEEASANNRPKKPLQSNSSSTNSLLLSSSNNSIVNGRIAKKSSLTNLNTLLDELILSDSYSSSSDSKSVSKRRHPQRSRLNKSPTSEALTSRRSLRSPTNIPPSEFDDDPFSLPYTSSDWYEDTENGHTRRAVLESGSDASINEQDLDIHDTASMIELQDTKIATAISGGIAVGHDDPGYHNSSNLDSIFQFLLSDSHAYVHSVAKSMSPISVETNLTSLTNSKATTHQRGKKALSPIPVRRNDAQIALTSSTGGLRADGGQSIVVKPTALSEARGALRNPLLRPPNQVKANEKVIHRTVSDGMQSTRTTKAADAVLKRTMSDGMKSTPQMSKSSSVVNVSSRKAVHDRVPEKIIRKSAPLTIQNPPSYEQAVDAVSVGIASIASSNSRSSGTKSVDKRAKRLSTAVDNSKYLATEDISGPTGKLPRSPRSNRSPRPNRSPRSSDPKPQMRQGSNSIKVPSRPPVNTGSVKIAAAAVKTATAARSSDSQPVEKIIKKTVSAGALSVKSGISEATSQPSDGSPPDNKDIRRRTSSSDGVKSEEKTSVISEGVKTRTTKADDDDHGSTSSPRSLVKAAKRSSESGEFRSRKHLTNNESNPTIKVNTNTPTIHEPSVKPMVSEPESSHKAIMKTSSKLNLSLTIDTKPFAAVESKDPSVSAKTLRRTRSYFVRKDLVNVEIMPEFQAAKKVIHAVTRQQTIVENSNVYDTDLPGVESLDEDFDSPSKKSSAAAAAAATTTSKLLKRTKSESMMGLFLPDDTNAVRNIDPLGTSRAVVQAVRTSRDSQVKTVVNDMVSDKQSFHDNKSVLQTMSVIEENKVGIEVGSDSANVVPSRPVVKAVRATRGNEESTLETSIAQGASRSIGDVKGSKALRRDVSSVELLKDDTSKMPSVPVFINSKPSADSKVLRRASSDVMTNYKGSATEGAEKDKTPTEMYQVSNGKPSADSKVLRRASSDVMTNYKEEAIIDGLNVQPDNTKPTRTSKSKSKSESDEKSKKSSSHSKDSGIDIGFIGAVINVSQKSKSQKVSSDGINAAITAGTIEEPSVKVPEITADIVAPNQLFTPEKAASDQHFTPVKVVTSASHPDYNFIMSSENYLQVVIDRVVHHGFKSISMDPVDIDDPDPLPESFLVSSDTSILVPIVMDGGTPQKLLASILNNSTPLSPIVAASPGSAFSTSRYSRRTRALHVSMAEPLATISPPKSTASSGSRRKCYHPKHDKDLFGATSTCIVLWCGRHCICSNCIKLHSINESHSPLLTCYRCQNHIPEPTNRSKPLFNIPRAANDCAVVTANAIVRKFRPASDRQYISHEDMRSVVNIINHRPYVEGMEYDMMEVLTALEIRNFYQTNCIIWHLDGKTKEVVIPEQALLIFLKSPQHFYTYIKMEPNKWRLFDSTHISVKVSLTLEELKIMLEPFMTSNPQYNTAAVAIINRQPCDINMKSCDLIACRTRVCGKHIVCSKCDVDDTRRANRMKNKLFYCNICMDPNTDSRSNALGEHE
jgi:hypothetical protein